MNILNQEKQIRIVNALVEGCSVRSTARMVGVEHKTVLRVLLRAGDHCARLLDDKVRGVHAKSIEVDEIWTYVFKKERRLTEKDDAAIMGDQYVFAAIGAEHKLIICHAIGKRDARTALGMIDDLKTRLVNRPQLTTDGFTPYPVAIEAVFGADVDYATVVKVYGGRPESGPEWYKPAAHVAEVVSTVITGEPNPWRISTSYVERQNLTMRMMLRRFTRLTNGFSKKLENLRAAVALHFAHYNFVRIHSSLRVTPAMQAGIASEVWSLEQLLP